MHFDWVAENALMVYKNDKQRLFIVMTWSYDSEDRKPVRTLPAEDVRIVSYGFRVPRVNGENIQIPQHHPYGR